MIHCENKFLAFFQNLHTFGSGIIWNKNISFKHYVLDRKTYIGTLKPFYEILLLVYHLLNAKKNSHPAKNK